MYEDSSTPTKIPQSVRKRDDKVRTFDPKEPETYQNIEEISYLPTYDEKSDRLEKLINEYNYTEEEKYIFDPSMEFRKINPKYMTQLMKNDIFYKNELEISNARIKYLDKIIKKNPKMSTKKRDMINELKSLYKIREKYFESRFNDPGSKEAIDLRLLREYAN